MPNYRITDPETGKTVTVSAKSPEAARQAAIDALRPSAPADSELRQKIEGFAQPIASFGAFASRATPPGFISNQILKAMGREPPSAESLVEPISSAGEGNPTPGYTFWRGVGRGTVGAGMLAATGGATAPLVAASMAGGIVGSEVETATGSGLAGAGADLLTSLLTANPGGAMRLASKLRLGGGTSDDTLAAATRAFESARTNARAAFSRVPTQVEGTANAARARELAQRLMQVNAPEDVPTFVRRIANWGDEVDFNSVRRAIASSSAARAAAGETTAAGRKAATGARMNEALDDLLKQFEGAQSAAAPAARALRDARDAWGKFRAAFPSKGSFAHAVLNEKTARETPEEALSFIFNSKTRQQDTRLLAQAITGDAIAEQGLRRGYLQYLAGSPDVAAFGSVMQRFNKTKDVARMLFGENATRALAKNLHRASSRSGDIANHPFMLVMSGGGLGTVLTQLASGGAPSVGAVAAAGTGAYWVTRALNARAAQNVLVASAYDDGLRQLLAKRVSRPESAELLSKVAAWAARNGVEIEEAARERVPIPRLE